MSAMYTKQVRDTPDLMLLILENFHKKDLYRMSTVGKALFPLVVIVLWRSVKYRVTENVDEYTPRGMCYMAAVRHLIIDDFPGCANEPADPKIDQELITSVISNFPNISTAKRIDSSRPWAPLWTLETWRDAENKQRRVVNLECVWKFEDGMVLEELEAPEPWEGYEMGLYITSKWQLPPRMLDAAHPFGMVTLAHFSSHQESRRAIGRYVKNLLDPAVRHPRICAINTDEVPVSLEDLQKIALYRHEGHLPVRSFMVAALEHASLEQLELFCEYCTGEIEELLLDGRRAGLPLRHIGRLATALARQPKLKVIGLPISILEGYDTFTPSSAISPPPSYRAATPLRALQQVTLNIYMPGPGDMRERPWYSFPVEEVARNLAWLGAGEGCKYVVKNKTSVFIGADVSQKLNEAVHTMQGFYHPKHTPKPMPLASPQQNFHLGQTASRPLGLPRLKATAISRGGIPLDLFSPPRPPLSSQSLPPTNTSAALPSVPSHSNGPPPGPEHTTPAAPRPVARPPSPHHPALSPPSSHLAPSHGHPPQLPNPSPSLKATGTPPLPMFTQLINPQLRPQGSTIISSAPDTSSQPSGPAGSPPPCV